MCRGQFSGPCAGALYVKLRCAMLQGDFDDEVIHQAQRFDGVSAARLSACVGPPRLCSQTSQHIADLYRRCNELRRRVEAYDVMLLGSGVSCFHSKSLDHEEEVKNAMSRLETMEDNLRRFVDSMSTTAVRRDRSDIPVECAQALERAVRGGLSVTRLHALEADVHTVQAWSTEFSGVLLRVKEMDVESSPLKAKEVQWAQGTAQQTSREVESIVNSLMSLNQKLEDRTTEITSRLCALEVHQKNTFGEEVALLSARVDALGTMLENDKKAMSETLKEMEGFTASIGSSADRAIQRVVQEIARELQSSGVSSDMSSSILSRDTSPDNPPPSLLGVPLSPRAFLDATTTIQAPSAEHGARQPCCRSVLGRSPRVQTDFRACSSAYAPSKQVMLTPGFGVPSFGAVDSVPQGPCFQHGVGNASSQRRRSSPKRWTSTQGGTDGDVNIPDVGPICQHASGYSGSSIPSCRVTLPPRVIDPVSPALKENLQELVSAIHRTLAGQEDMAIFAASKPFVATSDARQA
eukprot:CAMPEP_0194503132 /NCGR_PEP_ID=MMETSP0253-20130528/28206_1 /TAXON_ID=2966 /ORGANISM="Noctiluca scintillans" /LENGTH=520 /DNA_ID=CAMNT_0039345383 /DNA_START=118 /DNA_END=1678 /DNA_ORIENTATION=+